MLKKLSLSIAVSCLGSLDAFSQDAPLRPDHEKPTISPSASVPWHRVAQVNSNDLRMICRRTPAPVIPRSNDPLNSYRWHLKSVGQRVFADTWPCIGVDINMGTLHQRGIMGRGVTVAIVESAFDLDHPDLANNVVPGGSWDFLNESGDLTDVNEHSTAVAGIVSLSGLLGDRGRSVAPHASLVSFDAYGGVSTSDGEAVENATFREYFGAAWGEHPKAGNVDVFNNSLGLSPIGKYRDISHEEVRDWENIMGSTRAGRGGVYTWAGGNGYMMPKGILDGTSDDPFAGCDANRIGLSCDLTNMDFPSNFFPTITVASVNAQGKRSYFSSTGSSLWISAPGGEDGKQREYAGGGQRSYGPGILTTDSPGCDNGYNTSTSQNNALDGGSHFDPHCNYTAAFSGTSSAAPMVAGVAALMLGVNPGLTQRDVKYILAVTARPLDLWQPAVRYRGTTVESGWTRNAAGFRFSNRYGFGLVDASAAVTMARNFRSLPPLVDNGWVKSRSRASTIGGNARPAVMNVRVDQNFKVEGVQFGLTTTHTMPSNLVATLTSPSGTVSYVLTPFVNYRETEGFSIPLSSSNAFLGESARGNWTFRVVDVSGRPVGARLDAFQLRVVGHRNR